MRMLVLLSLLLTSASAAAPPPAPLQPVPTERQLAWHGLEAYAFVHFTVNTFTDREWGYGDESPAIFNPSAFDADQIARTVAEAGLSGLILTAKHHDGFCLWPSRYTDHSIARSPYRDGHGDIVREIADACRRHGLKLGVYLSPWDRNRADYGQPSYLQYYRNQLRELLTQYGPIFEVWFDGANGGDGYYGGAREKRTIDNATYYDWAETWRLVRELQPQAVMFSDGGPDARWVGNERGTAGDPCWSTINADGLLPGRADPAHLNVGDRRGRHWLPAEVDVSLRPGWFYHATEDARVKTPAELAAIYLSSVGRGANLILNLTPDRRGIIPEADVASLRAWRAWRDATFARDLAADAQVRASNTRGDDPHYAGQNVLGATPGAYWATDDGVTTPTLELDFPSARTFNLIQLREHLPLGQRVGAVAIDAWDTTTGRWVECATATSIGAQRLIATPDITTTKVRLRITSADFCPALARLALYRRPAQPGS